MVPPSQPDVPPLSNDNAFTTLRLATRAEHDRIEELLQLTAPMSLERYATVMAGFDAFLHAWEPRVHMALPARLQAWFEPRRRGAFARADVAWLRRRTGNTPPIIDASAIGALSFEDPAEVIGSLYVIEGSALGGRVIAPRLEATLQLAPGAGASYFHGFGDATGGLWRDFRVVAEREIGGTHAAIERACDGARHTFAALIALFAPLVVPASEADASRAERV